MRIKAFLSVFLIWFIAVHFLKCQNVLKSEAGITKVSSKLYNKGGSPAVHANVHFYPHNLDPRSGQSLSSSDSTTTDTNGNYSIILDTGTYTIEASSDSGFAFQDSLRVQIGPAVQANPDTLRAPGTIQGIVQLQPEDDPKTVFILFMGTRTFTMPDDSMGNFATDNMAAGTYRVRILTTAPNYRTKDTMLTVIAGTCNILSQPIVLQYTGISSPKDFIVSYDTLNETVVLSWNIPDTSLISGYNVYRSIKGQNFVLVTQAPLPKTKTTYYDTGLIIGTVYEYRIVSRTQAGVESKMVDVDRDTALIVSSALVTTTFSWSSINTIHDTASINDTVKIIVNYSNPTRKINRIEWFLDTAQSPRQTNIDSSLTGKDSIVYYCPPQAGLRQFIVKMTDAMNTASKDTFRLWVIQDMPVANAGNDCTVFMNDTFTLAGDAVQKFGNIIKWEWNIGNTGFKQVSSSDTTIITPAIPLHYPCILRVTDDDGNAGIDTMYLTIGKSWVAAESLSIGEAQDITLIENGNYLYTAFRDAGNGQKPSVIKLINTNWVSVGTPGFSDGQTNFLSFAFNDSIPYVAFLDWANAAKLTVMKFEGSNWISVGTPGFADGNYNSLAFNNGVPYLAFSDETNGGKATVMKYDGIQWLPVGLTGFSIGRADFISLVFYNNEPYVAYTDEGSSAGVIDKITVMRFDGSNWVPVGPVGFSQGAAYSSSLVIDNSQLYVTYSDDANARKLVVMKFIGANWVPVGPEGFSSDWATYPYLVVNNGVPYVSYCDSSNKVNVMFYNGSNWNSLGTDSLSIGYDPSVAIHNQTPYVAYSEDKNGRKLTVKKLK